MKKIIFFLNMTFAALFTYAQGLEDIIVETYYVTDANDSTVSDQEASDFYTGNLPAGTVTYRIYVDMAPGYKFQALYGDDIAPVNTLSISTTTSFYNNEDRGATTANAIDTSRLKDNTVMLDSWLSVGGAAKDMLGVLKSEDDGVGTIINGDAALQNNDVSAGIALTIEDGLLRGAPEDVTFVGITSGELDLFGADGYTQSGSFSTSTGSVASLNGSTGPTASNRVLVAQLTTDGKLSFNLNIQIGKDGEVERYVANNPGNDEVQFAACSYPPNSGFDTVRIASPSAEDTNYVEGDSVLIEVTATNTDSVAIMEFFVDGIKVGEDISSPYSIKWLSDEFGSVAITGRATYDNGTKATSDPMVLDLAFNEPPVITGLISGSNGLFTLNDTITFSTAVSDDDSVAKVEYFVIGSKIGESTTSPYAVDYVAAGLGTLVLRVIASDNKGKKDTLLTNFTVSNKRIAITNPTNNASFIILDTVNITISTILDSSSTDSIELFMNNSKIQGGLFDSYQWIPNTAGEFILKAAITDTAGLVDTSDAVRVTVIDNELPKLSFISPADSAKLFTGDNVKIEVDIFDLDGTIAEADLFINGIKIPLFIKIDSFYTSSWSSTLVDTFEIKAVATDNKGAKDSAMITVYRNDNVPPTVNITDPANDQVFTEGDMVEIEAVASDTDGSVEEVHLFLNGNTISVDTVAPYEYNWLGDTIGTFTVFAIAVDDRGDSTTSASISFSIEELKDTIIPSSVRVVSAENSVLIYPSIVKDQVNIELLNKTSYSVRSISIFTALGEHVKTIEDGITSGKIMLNMTEYEKGAYFIHIKTGISDFSKMIIKH